MITLRNGVTTLALPSDLQWSDEFTWRPVDQVAEWSISGALLLQTAAKQGGRPVTLEPIDERSGWISRADLLQLQAWAAVPGLVLALTLYGLERQVVFRHQDTPIDARPVVPFEDVQATDNYLATVRLMEI